MAILGTLLKHVRAGEVRLAWNLPALAGPETLDLRSADFRHDGTIPVSHIGRRAGGQNLSPSLAWTGVSPDAVQLLLVVQDVDTPTRSPFVHCVALVPPELGTLPVGALNAGSTVPGLRVLRSGMGQGYMGPKPIKGHGPHRYVFQLFALPAAITSAEVGTALDAARPRSVFAAAGGPVLARGRLDGLYAR
ncbi:MULTISPECIES: YbhB/YbcL family Raf kinase inhibitor-like protein [unclassified Streptomyces]|uniref:YbhB/YbcL family Raf kinase inhibitor-like protein n=1 Tax=unclassified Streptomyces TaxID=2593676 RepID=UPI0036607EFC